MKNTIYMMWDEEIYAGIIVNQKKEFDSFKKDPCSIPFDEFYEEVVATLVNKDPDKLKNGQKFKITIESI